MPDRTDDTFSVTIPLLNPNEPEAQVAAVHVKAGQLVAAGDPLCTLDECKQAGLCSFAALPLLKGEQALGVLGESRPVAMTSRIVRSSDCRTRIALADFCPDMRRCIARGTSR